MATKQQCRTELKRKRHDYLSAPNNLEWLFIIYVVLNHRLTACTKIRNLVFVQNLQASSPFPAKHDSKSSYLP